MPGVETAAIYKVNGAGFPAVTFAEVKIKIRYSGIRGNGK